MALEPAGLESDGAAGNGPCGTVCSCAHAAAWGMLVVVLRGGGRRGEAVKRVRWESS